MIPGYNHKSYELTNSFISHSIAFIPYNHSSLANQIGERSEIDDERPIWNEISEQLNNCKYNIARDIKMSRANELKILSLNIRSLIKNIEHFRENTDHFNNYDILCMDETNCNIDLLPHGIEDLLIDGFNATIIQNPFRKSIKGEVLPYLLTVEYVRRQIFKFWIIKLTMTIVLVI